MRRGLASQVAVVALAGVVVIVGAPGRLAFAAAGAAFPFTVAGAAFPDVDSRRSVPFRRFRVGAALLTGAVAGALLNRGRTGLITVAGWFPVTDPRFLAGIWVGGAAVGVGALTFLFVDEVLPPHRGHLHQLPTGVAATAILFSLLSLGTVTAGVPRPILVAGVAASGFLVGFGSHLIADRDPRTGERLLLRRRTYVGRTLDGVMATHLDPRLAAVGRRLGTAWRRLTAPWRRLASVVSPLGRLRGFFAGGRRLLVRARRWATERWTHTLDRVRGRRREEESRRL